MIRAGIALSFTACAFEPPPAIPTDARPDTIDVPIDQPPSSPRVTTGLIGFWTFNDGAGSTTAIDTAPSGAAVPLKIEVGGAVGAPSFTGGTVLATTPARMISAKSTHLPSDCTTGVTLEMWLRPHTDMQGTATEPRFVAGLATNVAKRDVVLLHAGNTWLGRVRTTAAESGTPSLVSVSAPTSFAMTHVVLVADGAQRKLYVNNIPEAIDPVTGPPLAWDLTSVMALFDEPAGGRQWVGEFAMVALYQRGLDPAEVQQNFDAGADAP
ncbi:MAG: LamG-like jellyroll fold domain-containing protein [Kofleriaceae bacterium]